jgi:hypothetical protein
MASTFATSSSLSDPASYYCFDCDSRHKLASDAPTFIREDDRGGIVKPNLPWADDQPPQYHVCVGSIARQGTIIIRMKKLLMAPPSKSLKRSGMQRKSAFSWLSNNQSSTDADWQPTCPNPSPN